MKLLPLVVLWGLFSRACAAANDEPDEENSLRVDLSSSWPIPFHLRVIESIANFNVSWYDKVLHAITSDDDEDSFEVLGDVTDKEFYDRIMQEVGLDEVNRWLVNYYISSNYYSPKIQTHFEDYQLGISEKKYDIEKCASDSFGNSVGDGSNNFAWVVSEDRIYCSPDDLFALQLTKKSDMSHDIKSYDRVVGENQDAPLVILFGDVKSESFGEMLKHLYDSALSGKLRFVWRYIPTGENTHQLSHYGVKLISKDTTFSDNDDLGLKLASMVLSSEGTDEEKYELLLELTSNLPAHLKQIKSHEISDDSIKHAVSTNINLGAGDDTLGIFVNGAIVNKLELDSFKIMSKIREELDTIEQMSDLGFNFLQTKHLLKKFALNSAVHQVEFNRGLKDNRFKLYEHAYEPGNPSQAGPVAYINDIEIDENYDSFTRSRQEAYVTKRTAAHGQIPPLRENIYDLVFVINLSDKEQLKQFFTLSKIILDRNIPQQIGILPLLDSELDRKIAKYFFFLFEQTPREALGFLYKVFSGDTELDDLFASIPISKFDFDQKSNEHILQKFSLTNPSVVFNGIIKSLYSDTWQLDMGRQITQDVDTLAKHIESSKHKVGSLRSVLYKDGVSSRNLAILPENSNGFKYKRVTKELLGIANTITRKGSDELSLRNLWVIGSSTSQRFLDQCKEALKLVQNKDLNIQLKFIDVENQPKKVQKELKPSGDLEFTFSVIPSELIFSTLADAMLPSSHTFLLFGSRYIRVDEWLSSDDMIFLINQEKSYSTGRIEKLFRIYSDLLRNQQTVFKKSVMTSKADWSDLLHSTLLKSFFLDDDTYLDDVSRFDLSALTHDNSLYLNKHSPESRIDLQVVVDPLNPDSREMIALVNSFRDFPFLKIEVLLQPKLEHSEAASVQYFHHAFARSEISFNDEGYVKVPSIKFTNVPETDTFFLEVVTPKRWLVTTKNCPVDLDPENIKIGELQDKVSSISFELKGILIEGYAKDVSSGLPASGTEISVSKGDKTKRTTVLKTLGYFQLSVDFGSWKIQTVANKVQEYMALLSASQNPFERSQTEELEITVDTLNGLVLKPLLKKSSDKPVNSVKEKHAEVNIFTIASGLSYEHMASIMTLSVLKNTKSSVKFWFIDNFSSPQFKATIPKLADQHGFSYEFVSYKWPAWLRKQDQRYRTVWGYKILFMDVLFPTDLDKVIFVDADQINRSDMKELTAVDLGESPYGFVPMCESREETEGFRFWNQGYWANVLKDDYNYHISALFVVDLVKFRQMSVGDKLRSHYQKLSSDPNSLSNLDQDLPNNLQGVVPIFSLPQDYLWCETWCSDGELKGAKNVDLCSNPLTKESKFDTAKRILPEWKSYSKVVQKIFDDVKENWHYQVVDEAESGARVDNAEDLTEQNDLHDEL